MKRAHAATTLAEQRGSNLQSLGAALAGAHRAGFPVTPSSTTEALAAVASATTLEGLRAAAVAARAALTEQGLANASAFQQIAAAVASRADQITEAAIAAALEPEQTTPPAEPAPTEGE